MTECRSIKQFYNDENLLLGSEVIIVHNGQTFFSRVNHPLNDTPHGRAAQLQAFHQRCRRHGYG